MSLTHELQTMLYIKYWPLPLLRGAKIMVLNRGRHDHCIVNLSSLCMFSDCMARTPVMLVCAGANVIRGVAGAAVLAFFDKFKQGYVYLRYRNKP